MKKNMRASFAVASTLMLTALLAACGGGGGGGGSLPTTGGGGGGGSTPTPPPSTTPTPPPGGGGSTPTPPPGGGGSTPTPAPGATGQLTIGASALANGTVVFTCGCNGDGGKISTNASGQYTITGSAPSVLGNGTYSPNGNNLMVVGYATNHAQSWTMMFLGATPSHNITLSPSASVNTNDTASTAAALYVYYAASLLASNDKTFDWFNFNQIVAFTKNLRTNANGAEKQLMSDIVAAQNAGQSMYPSFVATWNGAPGAGVNSTITADVKAVVNSGDVTLPTPCPSVNGCSNAPTP